MTTAPTPKAPTKVAPDFESLLASDTQPTPPGPLSATLTLTWRAALKLKRNAVEHTIDLLLMPVIFLLIFNYLFGGAFAGSTSEYLQFFLPGVLVMSAVLLTTSTGVTVNLDIVKGIFDRFRTMPFWQPASLVGTMVADLGRYLVALVLTAGLGLLLGFRPEAGLVGILQAFALILVFTFAFSWIFTALGLVVSKPETLQATSILLMAVVFCSNIFVDSDTMPGWMQTIVDINPVSHMATASRGLLHGTVTTWDLVLVGVSTAVLLVVFAPLTMYLYNRKKNA
jgi:ABC-2 type transport system permease protein